MQRCTMGREGKQRANGGASTGRGLTVADEVANRQRDHPERRVADPSEQPHSCHAVRICHTGTLQMNQSMTKPSHADKDWVLTATVALDPMSGVRCVASEIDRYPLPRTWPS